jgi:isocitrate lyase
VVAAVSSIIPTSLANMGVTSDAEDQYYQEEVRQLKEWWNDSRWRYTKRPFTAEQIASKRGNLPIQYPSNTMSKKLWKNLEEKFAVRYQHSASCHLNPVLTNCRAAMQATHTAVSTRSW